MSNLKSTNPKDAVGSTKVPMHLWPATATAVGSIGLLEGMLKYGRNNWRAESVLASVYVSAAIRHLTEWFEGADNSLDSNVPHLGNALACLAIIVDAKAHKCLIDDRNFGDAAAFQELLVGLRGNVAQLVEQYGEIQPVHYTKLTPHVSETGNDVHLQRASAVPRTTSVAQGKDAQRVQRRHR